jgi:hypothetical protein
VIDSKDLKVTRRRPYFTSICTLLLLVAAAVVWGGQRTPADNTPRAVTGATSYNFGQVFEDRALSHTFLIHNTGTATLKIEEVDPDCACTVASFDKTIPTGGQGEITLTIKPFSVLNQFKKVTKIRLNDPERPLIHLTMAGMAQPCIEIQPSHIMRLRGNPGAGIRGQVRFISHLPTAWKITDYRTTIPTQIEVTLKPETPDKIYVLEVSNKSQQVGTYAGLIELFTTSKQRPRLIVRVFGDIYLPSASHR